MASARRPALADHHTLTVRSSNATPVLPGVTDKIVSEGQSLHFSLSATDPDGDAARQSRSRTCRRAKLDPAAGVFDWTPTYSQAGDYTNIKAIASDGQRSSFATFTVFVQNTNRAPQMVPLAPQYGIEGNPMLFSVTAGDADSDPIVYSASNLPAGASFNAGSATFTWTPGFEQAGAYTVTFTATDPSGLTDSTQVILRIDNVNRAPIVHTSDHSVRLGSVLHFFIGRPIRTSMRRSRTPASTCPRGDRQPDDRRIRLATRPRAGGRIRPRRERVRRRSHRVANDRLRAAVDLPLPDVTIELTPSFPVNPGSAVLVHIIADSLADITSLTATYNGQPLTLDARAAARPRRPRPASSSSPATATDADNLVGTVTKHAQSQRSER